MMKILGLAGLVLVSSLIVDFSLYAQPTRSALSSTEDTYKGFLQPVDLARTKLWWWHGDVLTTREGTTADLEAYKKAGVGGVVYYDQMFGKGVDGYDPLQR